MYSHSYLTNILPTTYFFPYQFNIKNKPYIIVHLSIAFLFFSFLLFLLNSDVSHPYFCHCMKVDIQYLAALWVNAIHLIILLTSLICSLSPQPLLPQLQSWLNFQLLLQLILLVQGFITVSEGHQRKNCNATILSHYCVWKKGTQTPKLLLLLPLKDSDTARWTEKVSSQNKVITYSCRTFIQKTSNSEQWRVYGKHFIAGN